ncbi:polysaccharide deacetylase family protein [Aneurinibacillus sp. Ricciae_BoGa-3]|uniref:polysaccharide deacetylase family protein n=1 Tax=Aneurinibacillus sp. Ricciae_BoGa-3 TaxID=3022697 RepID=UPI002340D861|nr:polysaccharide deacetylase family protein [Aneurinibacillus sp. Ricciae_BoGa-3]WCK52847.1 polysaccharide deacetylase family protein [Aneurinibacillus sp. Ricciae_BoGa-3]
MKRLGIMLAVCIILYFVTVSEPVSQFINSRRLAPVSAGNVGQWQQLLENAKRSSIAPINARMDPIWKAIPGYNGLTVDEAATLANMRQAGKWDQKKIVYKETPPSIQLEQLDIAPVYRGNPEKPMVSFMINVAWGNEYLPKILRTLAQANVKATFFLDGSWTKKYPEEANKIVQAGHEIGSHAYSHPNMSKISNARIEDEITRTNAVIQEATGITPTLFAPPSGDFDDRVVEAAARYQMKTILWTADTVDWRKPSSEQWFRTVAPKIGNGVLILMHPTESTADTLPRLIEYIRAKKLSIGIVSETLSSKRVTVE